MTTREFSLPSELLQKWQETVDLLAEIIQVPAALIAQVMPPELIICVSSASAGNPYTRGNKLPGNTRGYCEMVLQTRQPLLVMNTRADVAGPSHPDGTPDIIAYLGLPLAWPNGDLFGTICVLDNKPRSYSALHQRLMRQFRAALAADLHALFLIRHQEAREPLTQGRNGLHDSTEQEQAAEALRQSQQKYEALVNSIDGIVWEVDARTFQFTFVSPQAERLLGYPVARWLAEPTFWLDHLHPEDRQWAMAFCVQATQEKRDHEFQYRMLAADGRVVWLHDLVTVVVESDQAVRLRGILVDITERKGAEEALRRAYDDLEAKVAARTAELAVAKARAEEADRLKSAFLATMSHELRTPLNSILGFSSILLQGLSGPLNAEQTKQLLMVKSSASHLRNLINDVLDLSKIEAGHMEVRLEPFDMRQVIAKTVQTMAPLARKKQLTLIVDVAQAVHRVVSDARRVEQILLNLVSNAIKFTEHGEVRLACRSNGEQLLTSVADTGMGIKADDVRKLFTTFRQLDSTLTRQHEGTGLGLAICQKLVALLGGEIRVDSQWQVGSTFTVVLPLHGPDKTGPPG